MTNTSLVRTLSRFTDPASTPSRPSTDSLVRPVLDPAHSHQAWLPRRPQGQGAPHFGGRAVILPVPVLSAPIKPLEWQDRTESGKIAQRAELYPLRGAAQSEGTYARPSLANPLRPEIEAYALHVALRVIHSDSLSISNELARLGSDVWRGRWEWSIFRVGRGVFNRVCSVFPALTTAIGARSMCAGGASCR
ncbi:hypothetical protein B0H13DRAFT_2064993, partial [Mycena leptocephala]